jgi:hypothetical protein
VLLAAFAVVPVSTPSPRGSDAPNTVFSAVRARAELSVIAARPHPVGSEANEFVRDHLVLRAREAGLSVEVQRAGEAQNVIVRLPGTGSTGEVLVTAHYDAAPLAPGAGDAGVAVAALLESMRTLASGPMLRNDVVFLFSDGEEAGWLGSNAFVRSSEADRVAVVVAMESEPGNGPTTLQQTSTGDGWLIRQLAAADPPAWVSSVSNSAERDDFDSDFDVLSQAGLVGIEFANPKDATRYHSPRDTVDAVDLGHLQAHGDTVMSLVRRFGDLDLRRSWDDSDHVFTTLPVVGIVSIETQVANALAVAALVALAALVLYLYRQGVMSGRAALRGFGVMGVAITALMVAGTVIWAVVTEAFGATDTADFPDFDGSKVAMILMLGVTCATFALGLRRYARARDVLEVALGALAWIGVVQVLLMVANPSAISLATWPLLAGIGATAVWTVGSRQVAPLALTVFAAPSLMLLLPQLVLWIESPSEPMALVMLVAAVLLGSLIPQLATMLGCSAPGSNSPHSTDQPTEPDDHSHAEPDAKTVSTEPETKRRDNQAPTGALLGTTGSATTRT